jgi:hypothetical protein
MSRSEHIRKRALLLTCMTYARHGLWADKTTNICALRAVDFSDLRFITYKVRHGRAWSADEVRRLLDLAAAGMSVEAIATSLRRSPSSIKNKAGMQGISIRSSSSPHVKLDSAACTCAALRVLSRNSVHETCEECAAR